MENVLRQAVLGFQAVKSLWMKGQEKAYHNKGWCWLKTTQSLLDLSFVPLRKQICLPKFAIGYAQ